MLLGLHIAVGTLLILLNLAAGVIGGWAWWKLRPSIPFWYLLRSAQVAVFIQAALGALLLSPITRRRKISTTSTASCPW